MGKGGKRGSMKVLRRAGPGGRRDFTGGLGRKKVASAAFVGLMVVGGCAPPDGDEPPRDSVACATLGVTSVDFMRDVQPILSDHCIACHGADEQARAAGLRLDTREGMFQTRLNGRPPAVTPGDPASLLLQRVQATDGSQMPPAVASDTLTEHEVTMLECWVASGARYPDSWILSVPLRPTPPDVANTAFVSNPIDAFIVAELEAAGLTPAPPAPPHQLLRRLSFDLRGLPPSLEEVTAFEADSSEAAYLALVDKMLDEPSFGEHRARYWLDAARYADTSGYAPDFYRSIWPYRDYVIQAFNSNKPFDRFTVEQLAGDLLPDSSIETQTATGFIRNSMSIGEVGVVPEEYAVRYANDRVEALSSIWLGLTTGCAACHDHKYDPILQKEFYALTAYFNNTTQAIIDAGEPDAPPTILVPPSMTPTLVSFEANGTPEAYVLERGRYDAPGERVVAGVPQALPPLPEGAPNNRLGLAQWLVSPDHPLTARVTANRFWAEVFGVGLVATAHDFGKAGDTPSHPELLDWLAVEFRESGWDVKHLFRLMVTSSSYRQAATVTPDKLTRDPDNRLLSRGPRFRMDGEMIRDLALAASGLLVQQVGGPSVKPYQPPGLWEEVSLPDNPEHYSYVPDTGAGLYRRSVYTFWRRSVPPPSLQIFNAPSREQSVVQRERSNTPLQALVTLNDVQFVEAARQLAVRALSATPDSAERLHLMARLVLARPLDQEELTLMTATLDALKTKYQAEPALADSLLLNGESSNPTSIAGPELAAWTMVASTFLNLDEALNR